MKSHKYRINSNKAGTEYNRNKEQRVKRKKIANDKPNSINNYIKFKCVLSRTSLREKTIYKRGDNTYKYEYVI